MDRLIQYPAQIPLVEDMLNAQRNAMVGVGHLAGATFGANRVAASGFACTPGEGLALTIAPGAILAPGVVDASAYGTLAAVNSALVRQFISRDPVILAVPAAGATYIVSVAPQTADTDDTVLPFYNAADPSVTYAGEGNNGLAAPTVRRDEAVLSIGTSVPEGSYPLWQIVVPTGATAITVDMIAVASGAPFYPSLAAVASRIVAPFNAQLAVAMGGYPLNAMVADPTTPGIFWVSTQDSNLTVPGANGAAWVDLFSGYLSKAAASAEFVSSNYGAQVGDYNSKSLFMRGDNPVYGYAGPNGVVWLSLTTVAQTQAETAARTAADTALQSNIDSEAQTRLGGDNYLNGLITTEVDTRAAAVTTLTTNLAAEITARENADTTLQTNINTETTARTNADAALQTSINTEAQTRLDADNYLNGLITAETARATTAESNLQSSKANQSGGNHLTGNQLITDGSQFATTGNYTSTSGQVYNTAIVQGTSPNNTRYQIALREYAGSHYSMLHYIYDGTNFSIYEMPQTAYNGGRLLCPAGTGAVLSDLPLSDTSLKIQAFVTGAVVNGSRVNFPVSFSGEPVSINTTAAGGADADSYTYEWDTAGFTIGIPSGSPGANKPFSVIAVGPK